MIKAKVVADSINESGDRLTTFIITFPRYILAEFNTHRMLSKNSASSRARPHRVMLKDVMENPFIPIKWMKEHTGMQGTEYFDDEASIDKLTKQWLAARDSAVEFSKSFDMIEEKPKGDTTVPVGLTKQLSNRLLEPFLMHTVIVTGTEWGNFFALRDNEAADIHIQDLAHKMLIEYNLSNPKQLNPGEWHIPFGDQMEEERIADVSSDKSLEMTKIKIATARCARISYIPFGEEKQYDYKKDIELHDRLSRMGHMSPFEHCAKSMNPDEYKSSSRTNFETNTPEFGWCGNFKGFIQYRKMFKGENKQDPRVITK